MKYLVTDPCYIHPKDTWQEFVDMYYNGGLPEKGHPMNGIGKIIACENTDNGDGMTTVTDYKGNKQFIGVDSGLVSIIEVSNVYKPKDTAFISMTRDREEAFEWYEKALKI